MRHLQRQTRLPMPPGPVSVTWCPLSEQAADTFDVPLPTDHAREVERQIVEPGG
jgi:hypothetical protein